MKKYYYSRKLKQLQALSRRVQYLLKHRDEKGIEQLERLRMKLHKLIADLKFVISKKELKRALGIAVLVFGLSFTHQAKAQWFEAPVENPFNLTATSSLNLPAVSDLDDDGDFDILSGEYYGVMQYFENTGTANSPSFADPVQNPFGLSSAYYYALPAFADLDDDGDDDLLVNEYYGVFQYYENIGTASDPDFDDPVANAFGLDSLEFLGSTAFADIDDDGDIDIFVGSYTYDEGPYAYENGALFFYENIGTATSPAFDTPVENPFGFTTPSDTTGFFFPSLGDLDEDGDLDLLISGYNTVYYFENTGTLSSPVFEAGVLDPFGIESNPYQVNPILVDLDDDSDLDLLMGGTYSDEYSYEANIYYLENIGTAPVGISELNDNVDLTIYPNPVNDLLTIETEKSIDRVELIDVMGKTSQLSLSSTNRVNIGNASPGMYTLRIVFSNGTYATKKIMKK